MSGDLDLCVDRASEVPVGTQLTWKLRTLIATGQLPPGTRLPGIRELAELADVNINTVRSVLARLEEQGLLITQQGRGNFVAESARPHASLAQTADAVISHVVSAGIDPRDLAAALYVAPRSGTANEESIGPGLPTARDLTGERHAQRQALRTEIRQLELELAELEPLGPLQEQPPEAKARILSADELADLRDSLAARVEHLRWQRHLWRVESERLREAEEQQAVRSRRSSSGVWTGRVAGVSVSWTSA